MGELNGTSSGQARLRPATAEDVPRIVELMRVSILGLFPAVHTPEQTASAAVHIAHLDQMLIDDGTYFVHEADVGELVACGGWSRRSKLYTGSGSGSADDDLRLLDPATEPARIRAMFVRQDWTRRGLARAILDECRKAAAGDGFQSLILMATMPGVPLYAAFGFEAVESADIAMPDGTSVPGLVMRRSLAGDE